MFLNNKSSNDLIIFKKNVLTRILLLANNNRDYFTNLIFPFVRNF